MSYYRHVPNKIKKTFCGKLESFGHSLLFWDICRSSRNQFSRLRRFRFHFRNKVDKGISRASRFYNYVYSNTLLYILQLTFFFYPTQGSNSDVIFHNHTTSPLDSVSQNCGRQPHIVSTNHSNLIAVGPNRSLASRQAIVWTYRPRVEATESQPPDFFSGRNRTIRREEKRERALLLEIFNFQFWKLKQEVGRGAYKQKSRINKNSKWIFIFYRFLFYFKINVTRVSIQYNSKLF